MKPVYDSIVGKSFGLLTVSGANFSILRSGRRRRHVVCRCECGTVTVLLVESLKAGNTRSCGCLHKRKLSERQTRHGYARSGNTHPLYIVWGGMKKRCYSPAHQDYQAYGARGISVCDEWIRSPETFIQWALAEGWTPGMQIDRKENDAGYSPDNCRIVTSTANVRNRRCTILASAFGETKPVAEWCEDDRCSVSYGTLVARIQDYGWHPEVAIATPKRGSR